MKAASVNEIKQELSSLNASDIAALCLRLAKYKKDNKELLNYLLFESHDIDAYILSVKNEIDEMFKEVNQSQPYFAKKTLRKILRFANKHIKYTASKQAEVEILLHYSEALQQTIQLFKRNTALNTIYENQLKKIKQAMDGLHEDLQFEYKRQLEALR